MKASLWFGTALLLLAACTPPTTDPDQAIRDQLSGKEWMDDGTDTYGDPFFVIFYADGTSVFDHGPDGTWKYAKGKFTLKGTWGQDITASPDLNSSHFYFNYKGNLRHQELLR